MRGRRLLSRGEALLRGAVSTSTLVMAAAGGLSGPAPAAGQELPLEAWARNRLGEINAAGGTGETGLRIRLERIRAMYFLSVDEKEWVDRARDSLRAVRGNIPPGTSEEVTYQAYRGALEVVRAKHARWPGNKLNHLNRGAEILDDLVNRDPGNLEVRYLRLASYLFLPFFLRRDDSVASDLERLVRELPDQPEAFTPEVYRAVVRFVLDHGKLDEIAAGRLREALESEPSTRLDSIRPPIA